MFGGPEGKVCFFFKLYFSACRFYNFTFCLRAVFPKAPPTIPALYFQYNAYLLIEPKCLSHACWCRPAQMLWLWALCLPQSLAVRLAPAFRRHTKRGSSSSCKQKTLNSVFVQMMMMIWHYVIEKNILYVEPYCAMFLGRVIRQCTCSTWSRRFRRFSLRYVSTLVMMPSSLILSFNNCLLSCGWINMLTHNMQTVHPDRSLPSTDKQDMSSTFPVTQYLRTVDTVPRCPMYQMEECCHRVIKMWIFLAII